MLLLHLDAMLCRTLVEVGWELHLLIFFIVFRHLSSFNQIGCKGTSVVLDKIAKKRMMRVYIKAFFLLNNKFIRLNVKLKNRRVHIKLLTMSMESKIAINIID